MSNDGGVLRDPGPESGIFVHVMRDGDAVCGERGSVWTASKELFLTQPRISLSAAFSGTGWGRCIVHAACLVSNHRMSSCLREWAAIRPDVTLAKIASAKGRGQLSAVLAEDVVRPVAEAELVAQPAQQPLHAPILVGVVPVELDEDRLDGTCAPVWDETVTMRCLSDGRAQAEAQRTWAGLPVSKGAGAHQSTVERTAYSARHSCPLPRRSTPGVVFFTHKRES